MALTWGYHRLIIDDILAHPGPREEHVLAFSLETWIHAYFYKISHHYSFHHRHEATVTSIISIVKG